MRHRLLAGVILAGVCGCELGFTDETDGDTKDISKKTELCEQVMPKFDTVTAAWDPDEFLVPAVQVDVTEEVASAFISYNLCDQVASGAGYDHFDDLPGQGCLYKENRRVLTKQFFIYRLAAGQYRLAVAPCRYDGACAAPQEVAVEVPEHTLDDAQQRRAGEKDEIAKLIAEAADKVLGEQLSGPDAVNRAAGVLGQSGVADILSLAIDVAEFDKAVAQGQVESSSAATAGGCRFGVRLAGETTAGLKLAAEPGSGGGSDQSPLGDIDYEKALAEWTPRVTLVLAILGTGKAIYDLYEESKQLKVATEKVRVQNNAAVKANSIIEALAKNPAMSPDELAKLSFGMKTADEAFEKRMVSLLDELTPENRRKAGQLENIIGPRGFIDEEVVKKLNSPLAIEAPKVSTLSRSGKLKVAVGGVVVVGAAAVIFKDQIREQIDKLGLHGPNWEFELFKMLRQQ